MDDHTMHQQGDGTQRGIRLIGEEVRFMLRRIVLVGIFVLVCGTGMSKGWAQITVREFVSLCQDEPTVKQQARLIECLGYFQGLLDGYHAAMMVAEQQVRVPNKILCLPPEGIAAGRALALSLNWLRRRPDEQESPARIAVIEALAATYPCQSKMKSK